MTAEEPKELTADEKVARLATMAASGTMFVVALLGICSVFLPWWTGASATGTVNREATHIGVDASITLWASEVVMRVPVSMDSAELHTVTLNSDWSTFCRAEEIRTRSWPAACVAIEAARAFSILTAIIALAATVALMGGLVEPLALLGGAFLAFLTGLFAAVGVVCALLVSTSGLLGVGFFMIVVCAVLSALAMAFTLYAAAKAMPLEDPNASKEGVTISRVQRSTEQRKEEAKVREQLEYNMREHVERSKSRLSDLEEGVDEPRNFYYMAQVIEWTQKHSTADGEEIPLQLLEEAFREMDNDGSGSVDVEEFIDALRSCGLPASKGVVMTLVKEIDKNSNGEIDVIEFVEFFRSVEELDRFQHQTEQRGQFLTVVCSGCFLLHIVIVGVLLMFFIQMDEADTDPQNYSIMKNALVVCAVNLGLLFAVVILIPAVKLTLGANAAAWRRHYDKRFTKAKKKRPNSDAQTQDKSGPSRGGQAVSAGGLRQAGWSGGSDQGATVNAAIFGASYRVKKAQARLAELNRDWRGCMNGCGFEGTNEEVTKHEYLCPLRRRASLASEDPAVAAPPPPGVILGEDGSMQRYDPLAFRVEQMNQLGQHQPRTFVTMASRDTGQQQPQGGNERTANPNMLALEYSHSMSNIR